MLIRYLLDKHTYSRGDSNCENIFLYGYKKIDAFTLFKRIRGKYAGKNPASPRYQ